jgi:hypothetical protein
MIGEQKFDVVEPGRKYLLSDGTVLRFMGRGADGEVSGITNEELVQVLIHRLEIQRDTFKSREAGLAVTALENCEEKLWRWDINRAKGKMRLETKPEIKAAA